MEKGSDRNKFRYCRFGYHPDSEHCLSLVGDSDGSGIQRRHDASNDPEAAEISL